MPVEPGNPFPGYDDFLKGECVALTALDQFAGTTNPGLHFVDPGLLCYRLSALFKEEYPGRADC